MVSIQLIVNSEIFKLSLNLFLTHLRDQMACYELKGDLSPVMLKEIFQDSLKTSNLQGFVWKTIQACLVGKNCFFLIQILLIFGGRCNHYF